MVVFSFILTILGTIAVACAGAIMTIVAACIFFVHWNTPFIKASGRELSLILLGGIFLSFLTTFVIISKPTILVCGVMRFSIGICYTICYATVVIKTNRVARIFAIQFSEDTTGKSSKFKSKPIQNQPRFVSPLSSTLIVLFLISIEVVINVIWLVVDPPKTMRVNDPINKESRVLVCSGIDETIMAGLIYPFFLILAATLYAFKTRKCRYVYFNETRYILFANTVTTIHWFVYVPLYLAFTNLAIRPVILSFSLSVSGIVQLCCLLFPKLYLVVFKPRKNTRSEVMTTQQPRSMNLPDNSRPNSVGVGISDGPILLSRVYDRIPDVSFVNTLNVSMPRNCSIAGHAINLVNNPADELLSPSNGGKRHPTWSHELSLQERPRSRSLSISVSTQTKADCAAAPIPDGIQDIFISPDKNDIDSVTLDGIGIRNHVNDITGMTDDIVIRSNVKVSVTSDEFDDIHQIISQVMEEEENELSNDQIASIHTENFDDSPTKECPEFYCEQENDASVISSSCEGTPISKSC